MHKFKNIQQIIIHLIISKENLQSTSIMNEFFPAQFHSIHFNYFSSYAARYERKYGFSRQYCIEYI